jgi:hypothetical protein
MVVSLERNLSGKSTFSWKFKNSQTYCIVKIYCVYLFTPDEKKIAHAGENRLNCA